MNHLICQSSRSSITRKFPKRTILSLTIMLLAITSVGTANADMSVEYSDVMGQGGVGIAAYDGARLMRSDTKLVISVRIPTPVSGDYSYPGGNPFNPPAVPGNPEAFTLWAFVFNYPESCAIPWHCGPGDIANPAVATGVFGVAGHLVSGPVLQLNGAITLDTEPFDKNFLLEPRNAEVHLAIAPHGALQPDALPNQLKTPIGNPTFWWPAMFFVN